MVISKGPLLLDAVKIIGKLTSAAIGFEADYTTVASAESCEAGAPANSLETGGWPHHASAHDQGRRGAASSREAVQMGAEVYEEARISIRPGCGSPKSPENWNMPRDRRGLMACRSRPLSLRENGGALPHGRASAQPIPRRGFVVMDSGVILRGYCSDMTRTVHVGRVSREERRWYKAVLEAQLAGIAEVIPGKTAAQVDQAARQVLQKTKLDRYFTHSTGHGVGLEIHEPPRLGKGQSERLEPGMVITIEPGFTYRVKAAFESKTWWWSRSGCEILTPVTKELIEI